MFRFCSVPYPLTFLVTRAVSCCDVKSRVGCSDGRTGRSSGTSRWWGHQSNLESRRWRSWLRHYATSHKVAGSIPDGVIEICLWYNPSGRTMTLGPTQPLTEMSTRDISWGGGGKRRPVRRADKLSTFMCRLSWNLGAWTSWNPQGLYSDCFTFLFVGSVKSLDFSRPVWFQNLFSTNDLWLWLRGLALDLIGLNSNC